YASSPPPPPSTTLFPYTTLFRSGYGGDYGGGNVFRIIMPGPLLTLNAQPSSFHQMVLSLRTNYPGFTLQASSSLASGNWIDCTKDRKSTRLNSSHVAISYAAFCL